MATDSEIQLRELADDPDEVTPNEPESAETESESSLTVDSSSVDATDGPNQQTDIATLDSDSASGLSAEWSENPFETRRVELEEGRRGFGFSLSGGVMSPLGHVPLFVASVDPHGPAAKSGMLHPGDRIVAINGQTMEGKTHRDAVIAIKIACGPITLDVTQGEENILDFIVMD